MVTGYVHSHYKQELVNLLENRRSLDGFLIVKGMEGATQIDFRKDADNITVREGRSYVSKAKGKQIRYPKEEWDACTSLVEYTLETGTTALKGTKNIAREILVNQVQQIVGSLKIMDPAKARSQAKQGLDSGRALRHWENGCK
jgi:anthranilate phosphoribosyltransferase